MRVVVTGVTGMIGSALAARLTATGHEVTALSRSAGPGRHRWDPAVGLLDHRLLEGTGAVIHLAGAPLASGRWTIRRKRELRESRTGPTSLLATAIGRLRTPPPVFISASAIGIYGDAGENILTEQSPSGNDFLARLCQDWESAADPARHAGARVIHPRLGMVLSATGGALARMLPIFRLGLGGRLGNGRQWMSWISIDDVLDAVELMLQDDRLEGPVNLTSPHPVRNAKFAETLGAVLKRPARLPAPAPVLRLILGELADAALLASQRVLPARLLESGFRYTHPELQTALHQAMLSRD